MTPAGQAAFLIYAGFEYANALVQIISGGEAPDLSIEGLIILIAQFLVNMQKSNTTNMIRI